MTKNLTFAALVAFVLALAACISFAVPRDMSLMGGAPYEGTADASVTHTPTKYGSSTPWGGDLAGSSNTSQLVSGIRGHQLPALAVGALSYDGGSWYFGAGGGGSFTPGGDLIGDAGAQYVESISGDGGPVTIYTPQLSWATGTVAPTIMQAAASSDVVPQSLTLTPQAPYASAVTHVDPGDVVVTVPASISGATKEGGLQITNGGAPVVRAGIYGGGGSYGAIWFMDGNAPSISNFAFLGNQSFSYLNVPNGGSAIISLSSSPVVTVTGLSAALATTSIKGAVAVTTRTVNSSFTIDTTTTDYVILADTSGGVLTITLPAPTNGRSLLIVDKTNSFGTHNCTLARHGSEKIDGSAANQTLSSTGMRRRITSDGTDWYTEN